MAVGRHADAAASACVKISGFARVSGERTGRGRKSGGRGCVDFGNSVACVVDNLRETFLLRFKHFDCKPQNESTELTPTFCLIAASKK